MKFVSTLSPNGWLAFVHCLSLSGHAKVNLCIDLGLPVRAVHKASALVCATFSSLSRPSPPSVYFSSAFEYIPSCRGGGLLRKPVFFATRRGMYVATFYISYLQLKTWSKRIHNRLGCGMYLRVSTAFGVFKRSYHDGSWAFSNLKHFECTSFVITLLYRLKTYKPQTPYNISTLSPLQNSTK